ncbi:MAG: hypothetical protein FWH03_05055 [Firmicutes bacterium]|nr:hypothetical protein [Bacillota bacterium]
MFRDRRISYAIGIIAGALILGFMAVQFLYPHAGYGLFSSAGALFGISWAYGMLSVSVIILTIAAAAVAFTGLLGVPITANASSRNMKENRLANGYARLYNLFLLILLIAGIMVIAFGICTVALLGISFGNLKLGFYVTSITAIAAPIVARAKKFKYC